MKETTKQHVKNVFGSLISNDRAIDGAKNSPWWISIIMFILGIFLPIIPLMVQANNTYGASFLASNTYGFEVNATKAALDMVEQNYTFTVEGNHKLAVYKDGSAITPETFDFTYDVTVQEKKTSRIESHTVNVEKPIYQYINTQTNQIDLEIYWTTKPVSEITSNFYVALNNEKYQIGTTTFGLVEDDETTTDVNEAETAKYYAPSYIVYYPEGVLAVLKKANSVEIASTSYTGNNWNYFNVGDELLTKLTTVENMEKDVKNLEYCKAVKANYDEMFNVAYKDQKKTTFWYSTGVYLGIYALLSLFMGFMIWLLTRGKRNMYNYLKIHTCLMIQAYASVAPGLLGMVLGFIFKNYAMMFFIILIGLRTMWMSMKQLRPQY